MHFGDFGQEFICGVGLPLEGDPMAAQLRLFNGDRASPTDAALSFDDVIARYAEARSLKPRTVNELKTTARKLARWAALPANQHRSRTPMLVGSLSKEVLAEFLTWVFRDASQIETAAEAERKKVTNPGRAHNKAREHLRAVLTWCVDQELLPALPRLPPARDSVEAAGLYFFTDEELDQLYWATYRLPQPRGWDKPHGFGQYLRAALTMFVTYGVDTQLVWPVDAWAEGLRWRNLHPPGLSPDRQFRQECEWGWLSWRRQKTGRVFVAPLTQLLAAHLQSIRPTAEDAEAEIFGGTGTYRPCTLFQRLVRLAKIPDKTDPLTGQRRKWQLKDLRKTAATRHEDCTPGSASVVLGHASEGMAAVTAKHYANSAPLLARAIANLRYPPAFHAIVDETLRPPELLFAK
jgi:hypothetical protein